MNEITNVYLFLLKQPHEKIHAKVYNVGYENYTVIELAEMVRDMLGGNIPIEVTPTDDMLSYHVSSKKIKVELGFEATHNVQETKTDLKLAFDEGRVPNPLDDIRYYNIKTMQALNVT